jgi:4-alpha-glucanotransferase
MRVFQFGFGRDGSRLHRPRSYPEQAVAYTGTHDNDTLLGWLYDTHLRVPVRLRRRLGVRAYTGCPFVKAKNLRWSVISSLMGSSARWVIIPMQDILGLGAEARMNKPGTGQGNWTWRMAPGSLGRDAAERLSSLTARYRTV